MKEAARVLVVCDRAADAGALAKALEPFALDVVSAAGDAGARAAVRAHPVDAVVLHELAGSTAVSSRLAIELKARAQPRLLVVAAVGERFDPSRPPQGIDVALAPPAHPAQIAARIKLTLRLAIMEDEARLRAATLGARGVHVDLKLDDISRPRVNVLYVGHATPTFLGLATSLSGFGATLSAAFTTFTAFDFLHERDFDAVVVNALDKVDVGFTVCTAMRRNTRLFHTPAALIIDPLRFDLAQEAFEKGASDLLPVDADSEDVARRIMSLARERQRRMLIKAAFSQVRAPEVVDVMSGLATTSFFLDHIEAMARRAQRLERPLSMIVARTTTPDTAQPSERNMALRQIGSMIARLMRAEDFASELEPGAFAIAMPGAGRAAAEGAAHRIAAIAECTAFGGGPSADAFQVELRCEVGELARDEGARALLARTIKAFDRDAAFAPRRDAS
jgi:two-component system cell cycle response regulator PopA